MEGGLKQLSGKCAKEVLNPGSPLPTLPSRADPLPELTRSFLQEFVARPTPPNELLANRSDKVTGSKGCRFKMVPHRENGARPAIVGHHRGSKHCRCARKLTASDGQFPTPPWQARRYRPKRCTSDSAARWRLSKRPQAHRRRSVDADASGRHGRRHLADLSEGLPSGARR